MSYDQHFKKLKTIKKPMRPVLPSKAQEASQAKSQAPKPKGQSLFWAALSCVMVAVGTWVWTLGEEGIDHLMRKVEVQVFGVALANAEKPAEGAAAKEKVAGHEKDKKHEESKPSKNWTEEEISLFQKLEGKKKELDARQEELKSMEAELQRQKEEFEKKMASMEQMRTQIANKLEGQVAVDEQKLQSLVALYQNMKPTQAAKVIESLNDDLAVDILMKMKNKSAAEILNFMNADKAKKLSEQFAGYRALANKQN